MMQTKKHFIPYIILIVGFIISLWLTWPGNMTPDSYTQYQMAQAGIYSDHHSAIMSFVWRHLDMIYKGPGLMLALHLLLLYVAAGYGVSIFAGNWLSYLFAALPWFPIIFVYCFQIWKDVGFAFSFLFSTMVLSYAVAKNRQLKPIEQILFWLILFYGTCAKFQAQYCTPVIIAFYVLHHSQFFSKSKIKIFITFSIITSIFYGSYIYINNALVPEQQKNNSWQYVKIYDLSSISIDSGIMYVPKFLHTKYFTTKKFLANFNHKSVDSVVLIGNAIFRKAINKQELDALWWQWAKTIASHPILYIKHRAMNMGYVLLSIPEFNIVKDLLDHNFDINSITYKILYYSARLIGYLLVGHIVIVILSLAYLYLGIINFKKNWAAFPLVMLNSTNFMMLSTLFFCSMAGAPRYTYVIACLTSASHAFALICLKPNLYRRKI